MSFVEYMAVYVLSMLAFTALGYFACRRLCRVKERIVVSTPAPSCHQILKAAQSPLTDITPVPSPWIRRIDSASGTALDELAATHFSEVRREGRTDGQFRVELFRALARLHNLP